MTENGKNQRNAISESVATIDAITLEQRCCEKRRTIIKDEKWWATQGRVEILQVRQQSGQKPSGSNRGSRLEGRRGRVKLKAKRFQFGVMNWDCGDVTWRQARRKEGTCLPSEVVFGSRYVRLTWTGRLGGRKKTKMKKGLWKTI